MQLSYVGPAVDDEDIAARLPEDIVMSLRQHNGWIAFNGGLHMRGACREPNWHSLRQAWDGNDALHYLYRSVQAEDIPIAEDCFGDQYLLRDGTVVQLNSETGKIESLNMTWIGFLRQVEASPIEFLSLEALDQFIREGGLLAPDQLLSVYPPFVTIAETRSLRPITNLERRRFLADFAAQIEDIKDGQQIRIAVR